MQYRIKVPPWCFPALNHVLRLLQNNSCTQMEVWQRDAGARAAYPFPSEPMEGDGREAACSWPVSSLGQHKSPTYLHLHRARSKGSCSNQCSQVTHECTRSSIQSLQRQSQDGPCSSSCGQGQGPRATRPQLQQDATQCCDSNQEQEVAL